VIAYYVDLGVSAIRASIDPMNASSRKLLDKLGFVLEESKQDDLVFRRDSSQ